MASSTQFSSLFLPQYHTLGFSVLPTLGASTKRKLYPCLLNAVEDNGSKYSDWKVAVERCKHVDEKALWKLRPPKFCLDMHRQNVSINNVAYSLGSLSGQKGTDLLLDSQIITLLSMHYFLRENPAEESRQRVIHSLRYQIQDVMHQWIYKIDQEFIEGYFQSYAANGRVLMGMSEGTIALNITCERIEIVAKQRFKVVAFSKVDEICGYEAQRVIISISSSELDQSLLFLSQEHSPDVSVSFHGMVKAPEDLRF